MVKSSTLFVNPHIHHTYFTTLALSKNGPVHLICPPLILSLLLRRYITTGLNLVFSPISIFFYQPLSIFFFILYKLRLLTEKTYIRLLALVARIVIRRSDCKILYLYQDYFSSLSQLNHSLFTIVEFIIDFNTASANYITSLESAKAATISVVPSKAIYKSMAEAGIESLYVPYGGDKSSYATFWPPYLKSQAQSHRKFSPFKIVARSHNYRKGLDILLDSLQLLLKTNDYFPSLPTIVYICGTINDAILLRQIDKINSFAHPDCNLKIIHRQFSLTNYQKLLSEAKLFIMPSRREGSGLAALEALWWSVPSIISPECGVDHFQPGQHGLLLSPNTPFNLSQSIHNLIQSPDTLSFFKANLVNDRKMFTWDTYLHSISLLTLPTPND